MKKSISLFVFFLFSLVILVATTRGNFEALTTQWEVSPEVGSPFEASGSTSRYSLVQAIVEQGTMFFDDAKAKASAPDITRYEGHTFSIFTPGVSFLALPFYYIGRLIDFPQLVTYFSTALISLVSMGFIYYLARKIGAGHFASLLGGFTFLFGTNAFSYVHSLTQHHATALVVLMALTVVTSKKSLLSNLLFGVLAGVGLLLDLPAFIMLIPLGIYQLIRHIDVQTQKDKLQIKIDFRALLMAVGIVPLIVLFGWYNHTLTGSYFKLGQTIGRSDYIPREVKKTTEAKAIMYRGLNLPLRAKEQSRSLYLTLISDERGILVYMPVLILGFIGAIAAARSKDSQARQISFLISVTVVTIISLYSMHWDPWGGWAFGPRYMIPVAAITAVVLAYFIERHKKNILFAIIFLALNFYGLGVNTLGALTTSLVPPKVEAVTLINPIPWTYEYNWQLVQKNFSASLVRNTYLPHVPAYNYGLIIFIFLACSVASLYLLSLTERK